MVHKILSIFVLEKADRIEIIKDLVAYPLAYRVFVIRNDRQVYWTRIDNREVGYLMNEANRYNIECTIKDHARALIAIKPEEEEMGAELEACKRELEDINRELAYDIVDEPRLKRLGLRLHNIGYKLHPVSTYFKIARIGYTSPDLRKGLN